MSHPDGIISDRRNPTTGQTASYRNLPLAEFTALMPVVLCAGWRNLELGWYRSQRLTVGLSAGREEDGCRWLHLSVSRADNKVPTWEDLTEVRDMFLPRERTAFHLLPSRENAYDAKRAGHIPANSRKEIMHLWVCLDREPLPNFLRARGGTL